MLANHDGDQFTEQLPPPTPEMLDDNERQKVYVGTGEVESFRLKGWEVSYVEVTKLSVADQAICEAMVSGRNKIQIIGTANGVTRLTVEAHISELDGAELDITRDFEIHVIDTDDLKIDRLAEKLEIVNRSIRKAYPDCTARVETQSRQLIVKGLCDSDESAEDIVQLVRRTFLVPVDDQLETRDARRALAPMLFGPPNGLNAPNGIDCTPLIESVPMGQSWQPSLPQGDIEGH